MVPEGGTVRLTCRAKGHPLPHVQWRREDGQDIVVRDNKGHKHKGTLAFCYIDCKSTKKEANWAYGLS